MTARPSQTVMALTLGAHVAQASFTRPGDTTAYASGDLVANSTTAGSVVALTFAAPRIPGGGMRILAARLFKSGTGITSAAFRLHLLRATPTFNAGDNAALNITGGASYLGALDITCDRAFADGAFGRGLPLVGSAMVVMAAADDASLYGFLEARGAYTPGNAEAFTLTLELDRD
jgi:hypothetical protein